MQNVELPVESRPWRLAMLLVPVLAVVLLCAVWWAALDRAGDARAAAEANARKEADAAAQAYEQYVTRSIAQIDQVSMQLKQSWEQSDGRLRLTDMQREGMFLDGAFQTVSILDNDGRVLTSTRQGEAGKSLGAIRAFTYHRNNNDSSLRIGTPPGPVTSAHDTVLLTRRLESRDGDFSGVLLMMVPSTYFTSFFIPQALGDEGMLAMAGTENGLRAEQRVRTPAEAGSTAFPPDAGLWWSSSGVRLVEGPQGFPDGTRRILGWRHSTVYPVVALVSLSHAEAIAGAEAAWAETRRIALTVSLLILLAGGAGTILARRAARRFDAQEDVRAAYRTATESANDGFYMAAALRDESDEILDFEIIDCNERGAHFYGMAREKLIGSRLSQLDASIFGDTLFKTYCAAMESGFYEDERRMGEHSALKISWGARRLVRVGNGLAITLQDISERKAHVVELQRLANEDLLTGLRNRHWLMNAMPATLAALQAAQHQAALLFIDLDEFKFVNDTHGHACGDQLLKAAAQRLESLVRPGDHLVRFGGDEFIVILCPVEDDAQTARVAERIVAAFARPFALNEDAHQIGASVGISVFPRDGEDIATLIKHGDIAMYASKGDGKGQYRFFDPSLSTSLQTRSQLKHSLKAALDNDELVLHYQPRIDAQTGEMCSMEALLRWRHPVHGMIPPGEFIPLAESTGLIVRLGERVMELACRQLAAWRQDGSYLVPVSINVSPTQFSRGDVHRQLAALLHRYGIEPHLIEVEVTESAMMGDHPEVLAELAALRQLGIKLHVDDFGTGYSSLAQLQKLRMDVLKVDRAFTSELGRSKEGTVFFQAIVSMAHALGMTVVAEGVETPEQLAILRELGCNEAQGYLIARPMPAPDMAILLHKRFLLAA